MIDAVNMNVSGTTTLGTVNAIRLPAVEKLTPFMMALDHRSVPGEPPLPSLAKGMPRRGKTDFSSRHSHLNS